MSTDCIAMEVQSDQQFIEHLAVMLIMNGDIDGLKELVLENGLSVNARLSILNGLTLLHLVAANGHTQTVVRLLQLGAEKSIACDLYGTPLHLAVECCHISTVKVLLKARCPVDMVASDGKSVLHSAVMGGNVDIVNEVLRTGCDINRTAYNGVTPLHVAAMHGKTEAALELIKHGARTNIVAGPFRTPLHQAAVGGHVSTVKAMLKAGCPVDVVDSDGNSVLHAAAEGDSTEVIREVLNTGCDINRTGYNGVTPLHVAAANAKTEVALELIKQGANTAIVAGSLGTPLHLAAQNGHVSTVKAMLKAGCPVDVVSSSGRSVLSCAAESGNAEVIKVLSTWCNINATDVFGMTPLHAAAMYGKTEAVLELIRLGARKAMVFNLVGTPLHFAAQGCHVSTVKAMLKECCPVDAVDSFGMSVLHSAAIGGNVEVIREVLSTGCDINALANDGRTPLHLAAAHGKTEAALELIRHRAEKAIVAGTHGTALHQAAICGRVSTVKALLKTGCLVDVADSDGNSVLHAAADGDSVEVIREVLSTGCDINATNNAGQTPLHVAICNGRTKAMLELIRNGADKVIAGGFGTVTATSLHVAIPCDHVSIVKAMLKAGCPVDVVDSKGRSALHFAAAEGSNAGMIKEMLSTGCDIDATDNDGMTPLHLAALHGKTEAALELIRLGAKKAIISAEIGTPLLLAVLAGHVSTVKALLKAGCPVDAVKGDGRSILHYAAVSDNTEVIREVLSTGNCDINVVDSDGATPLHMAAVNGFDEAALELIRLGADKAITVGRWGTPLHQAALLGRASTVKALLNAGCPVDAVKDSMGASVLHFAASGGDITIIEELVRRGCDVNGTDSEGQTPLDYAAQLGRDEVVSRLVRYGADISSIGGTMGGPVLAAARRGQWSTVQALMEKGFPVDGVATDGMTLLHFAAIKEVQLLEQLAARGFSVSRRDCFGLTPLHYAILCGRCECIMALMQLGASTKVEAPLLGTALDICGFHTSWQGRLPDEMIVDFALCKELGINISSPYLFSEHTDTISVFEFHLFAVEGFKNTLRKPKNLRKVLSILSKHQLVNKSKLACLAAIHGDVEVLECLSDLLTTPTEPGQYYRRLKQLFPTQFGCDNTLQVLSECELNPLQLAIIAMMCMKDVLFHHSYMKLSNCKYTEVINFLATNDSFCCILNECLPNGLTPLDLAEQLGLDEAAAIISRAGGRQGFLSNIPEEIRSQHGPAILHLHEGLMQLTSIGPIGQQAVQAVLSQVFGRTTTAEQGTATEESHIRQQKVLDQKPNLSIISTHVIGHVNVERWRRLGISLNIPLEALTHISSTHSSCEDRYLEVLIYWLEHNEVASWRTLLEVLGHFETKHTMDQLTQEVLATQDSEVSLLTC